MAFRRVLLLLPLVHLAAGAATPTVPMTNAERLRRSLPPNPPVRRDKTLTARQNGVASQCPLLAAALGVRDLEGRQVGPCPFNQQTTTSTVEATATATVLTTIAADMVTVTAEQATVTAANGRNAAYPQGGGPVYYVFNEAERKQKEEKEKAAHKEKEEKEKGAHKDKNAKEAGWPSEPKEPNRHGKSHHSDKVNHQAKQGAKKGPGKQTRMHRPNRAVAR